MSNLQNTNSLTSGLEIYAIWVKKQVVTDHRCEKRVHMSSCNPNKVREMVSHLGTHFFINDNSNVCTMLLICVGNHNRLCLIVFELLVLQIDDKT